MTSFQPEDPERFAAAIARFDEENSRDPKQVLHGCVDQPYELAYSQWLTDWVLRLVSNASEPLRLAARCQHLCRWEIPRDSFPATRAGYLKWRQKLKEFHAEKATGILREVGYENSVIERVRNLNLKNEFPDDADCRVLEDALCLVFLERQFADLAARTDKNKMISALQKCWAKMTPKAHEFALQLPFSPGQQQLLDLALKPAG